MKCTFAVEPPISGDFDEYRMLFRLLHFVIVTDSGGGLRRFYCLQFSTSYGYRLIVTRVPIGRILANSITSGLYMRMQPWETSLPIEEGSLVP